jgi:lysophospholipase L1-like esterase
MCVGIGGRTEINMKEAKQIFSEVIGKGKHFQIKLLGDSITHGVGGTGFAQSGDPIVEGFSRNPDGFCWAKLFRDYMESNYDCTVINNGCTGTTVQHVIDNFQFLVSQEDDLVICTIGTNNRHQNKSEGPKREREEFLQDLYGKILLLANKFDASGKKYILVSNIPAAPRNEEDGELYWRILHMDDINRLYKKAAGELGFAHISMYDRFSEYIKEQRMEIDSLLGDGLHPNDEGYRVMFKLISEALGITPKTE